MLRLWLRPADLTRIRFADRLHPAGTVLLASQALRQPSVAAALPTLARVGNRVLVGDLGNAQPLHADA